MLLLALHAEGPAFEDNRTTSVIKTRKKFALGKANLGIGAVVQPELAIRGQSFKGDNSDDSSADVDGINPHLALSDTNLVFDADYEMANGWTVGYLVRFKPWIKGVEADRNYAEASHKSFGTLQIGHQKGVHDLWSKLAQKVMPTIWIDGAPDCQITEPKNAFNGSDLVGQTGVAFKINWMSHAWNGFKLAFSYTPDTKNTSGARGYFKLNEGDKEKGNQNILGDDKNKIFGRHHFTGVALYNLVKNDVDVTVAGTIMYEAKAYHADVHADVAKPKGALDDKAINNTLGWMLSGSVKYKKLSAGIEYLNSGTSRLPTDASVAKVGGRLNGFQKGHAGQALNVAVAYEIAAKHNVGLGAQYTWRTAGEKEDNLAKTTKMLGTLGYSWKFAECALWYTEVHYALYGKFDKDGNALSDKKEELQNNRGWAVMTGVRVEI